MYILLIITPQLIVCFTTVHSDNVSFC